MKKFDNNFHILGYTRVFRSEYISYSLIYKNRAEPLNQRPFKSIVAAKGSVQRKRARKHANVERLTGTAVASVRVINENAKIW